MKVSIGPYIKMNNSIVLIHCAPRLAAGPKTLKVANSEVRLVQTFWDVMKIQVPKMLEFQPDFRHGWKSKNHGP